MTKFEFKFVSSLAESCPLQQEINSKSELERLLEEGWIVVGKGICGAGDASVGHWLKREIAPAGVLKKSNGIFPRWTSGLIPHLKSQRRD